MTLETRFHLGDDVYGAWRDMAKTEVITGLPDEKFTKIKEIDYKDTGVAHNSSELKPKRT